jgi:hypothetical protein
MKNLPKEPSSELAALKLILPSHAIFNSDKPDVYVSAHCALFYTVIWGINIVVGMVMVVVVEREKRRMWLCWQNSGHQLSSRLLSHDFLHARIPNNAWKPNGT